MKQFVLCSRHLPVLSLAVLAMAALAPSSASQADRAVDNLRAFAKLYGYVRFFHPADEASAIDWAKFAVYGAERVKVARSSDELRIVLEELFLPLAPAAQIYPTAVRAEPRLPTSHPVFRRRAGVDPIHVSIRTVWYRWP
jgi:hypothetical protein